MSFFCLYSYILSHKNCSYLISFWNKTLAFFTLDETVTNMICQFFFIFLIKVGPHLLKSSISKTGEYCKKSNLQKLETILLKTRHTLWEGLLSTSDLHSRTYILERMFSYFPVPLNMDNLEWQIHYQVKAQNAQGTLMNIKTLTINLRFLCHFYIDISATKKSRGSIKHVY